MKEMTKKKHTDIEMYVIAGLGLLIGIIIGYVIGAFPI